MSFEDIKGQDRPVRILKEEIERDRIFSGYLFVGPDGVGKKKTAINFAKAINCQDKKNTPCGTCPSCKKIDSGAHPDVFLIEPGGASFSIGIDRVRSVIAKTNLKPYEARKKVFIINDAHSMKAQAANAFLKTLEEPPADTVFILISRFGDLLLPTIVSRCHVVKFFTSPPELVRDFLVDTIGVKEEEAEILCGFSSGRIGEALKMHERGFLKRKNRMIDSLTGPKGALSDEIGNYADKNELKENLELIVTFLRDMFIYKTLKNEEMLFNKDRIDAVKKECLRFTPEALDGLIKRMVSLCSYIDYNVNPKIVACVASNELGGVLCMK